MYIVFVRFLDQLRVPVLRSNRLDKGVQVEHLRSFPSYLYKDHQKLEKRPSSRRPREGIVSNICSSPS